MSPVPEETVVSDIQEVPPHYSEWLIVGLVCGYGLGVVWVS